MATYTHLTVAGSPVIAWIDTDIGDPIGVPSATLLVLANADGTETRIHGTGFTYTAGEPTGGTVTSVDRTNPGGATVYETVTGLSVPLGGLGGSGNNHAFATIFAGSDTFNGWSGADTLVGGASADTLNGGSGGLDLVTYQTAAAGLTADLGTPANNTGDAAGDVYTSIDGFVGSAFDDSLRGNAAANTLRGGAGNDFLRGRGGADVLDGGAGTNDYADYFGTVAVTASLAAPATNTGDAAGDTYLNIESLRGSDAADKLTGNSGDNFLRGGLNNDILDGGAGEDWADYGAATGAVTVSLLTNTSSGADGIDTLSNIERIRGGAFADKLTGNAGDNFLRGGLGNDTLDGGAGNDWADYFNATGAVTVNLTTNTASGADGADTLLNIERIRGGDFNDVLTGNAGENFLRGGKGNDTLNGMGGTKDWADYFGATGAVSVNLTTHTSSGADGVDTLSNIEHLRGSDFSDTLVGDSGLNFLRGGLGADVLNGAGGVDDYADYRGATAGLTANLLAPGGNTGEAAGDSYVGIEHLRGTDFADKLVGNAANNNLRGGLGADALDGGTGLDEAGYQDSTVGVTVSLATPASNTGEAAGDTFVSIEGIIGSAFADKLIGDAGNNSFRGDLGADTIDGGSAGFDTARYNQATSGVTVTLANGGDTGEAAGDIFISIEGLRGSTFNDRLVGNAGANSLFGDLGNDFLNGGLGADALDGGGGDFDYADYINSAAGLTVSLATPSSNTGEAVGDTYIAIKNIRGSNFADRLIGDAQDNNFLVGGLGADVLDGGAGTQDIAGYSNATAGLTANLTTPASNTGEAAGDTYIGIEGLAGSAFADTLIGNALDNVLRGELGADVLNGGGGIDFASYRAATAGLTASLATPASNTGEATGDTYTSIEGLFGSDFNDKLIGDGLNNFLRGRGGADVLDGGGGTDIADYQGVGEKTAVTANLTTPASNTGAAAGDTYISIEGLRGTDLADVLVGNASNNSLMGEGGNDFLNGRAGADALNGGTGFDYADYINSAAGLTVNLGAPAGNTGEAVGDTYTNVENIRGSNFADTLIGNSGDNLLRGGLGADVLNGGSGFDFADYHGATAGLTASLAAPASNTGEAAGDTYIGIENIGGSAFADRLIGNSGNNMMRGNGGADVLDGGTGFDFADYRLATAAITASLTAPATNTGEAAGDTYIGIEGLRGSDFNDRLTGDTANNFLNGGLGVDVLVGGTGFDTADYNSAASGLTVSLATPASNTGEAAGDTYNTIESIRGSSFNDRLIGDTGSNVLTGGLGADVIDGGSGTDFAAYSQATVGVTANLTTPASNTGEAAGDTYIGIEGLVGSALADKLVGNTGTNFLRGGLGADALDGSTGSDYADYIEATVGLTANLTTPAGNTGEAAGDTYVGIENLRGSRFADTLVGDAASNILRGSAGADVLNGGGGTDVADYSEATAALTVSLATPASNTGDAAGDTYISIESLRGSSFNDRLTGNTGNNVIEGNLGNDILTGGTGNDVFLFNTTLNATTNVDQIVDFNVPADTIRLENAVFTTLGAGALPATAFHIGAAAADADDRIIYNNVSGELFYDSNGNVAGGSIKFAQLTAGLALTAADFVVI